MATFVRRNKTNTTGKYRLATLLSHETVKKIGDLKKHLEVKEAQEVSTIIARHKAMRQAKNCSRATI